MCYCRDWWMNVAKFRCAMLFTVFVALLACCQCESRVMRDDELIRALLREGASSNVPDTKPHLADSVVNFTRKLAEFMETGRNTVVSPLSVVILLNLILLAVSGDTYQQLSDALFYPPGMDELLVHRHSAIQLAAIRYQSTGTSVNIANKLFMSSSMQPYESFLQNARNFYNASAETLPFATDELESRKRINSWVADETRGLIKSLINNPIAPDTTLVAGNAIYFNGSWAYPFDEKRTSAMYFQLDASNRIMTDTMFRMMTLPYAKYDDFAVTALPYEKAYHAMYIFLPDQAGESYLLQLEQRLSPAFLREVRSKMIEVRMSMNLPRFRMEYQTELSAVLQRMGSRDLFDPSRANFSRLTDYGGVSLSSVIHQAVINVNEKGTEAAAATLAISNRGGFITNFSALRPFLFIILDNRTGVPLFWGRMIRPATSNSERS